MSMDEAGNIRLWDVVLPWLHEKLTKSVITLAFKVKDLDST